ncbi:TPA: hypothetical protein N0F65_007750 [Lagenidium giganteum]|uniref:Phosphatidylinositol N-acetylglucosaminyltransferase subunit H conserved domain-containing protein n=1 Tax=Lagenidium giganteum TaxID=4803 RepID=A0AAV2Z2J4_9STRA|nr:TPA: hypothetical protein N0F65_007750 [Lagenidium giganteum]
MGGAAIDVRVQVYGGHAVEYSVHRREIDASSDSWFSLLMTLLMGVFFAQWLQHRDRRLLHYAAAMAVFVLFLRRSARAAVVAESLLVIPGLGVQLTRRCRSGAKTIKFIDVANIRAVVVNEAITFSQVVYYLAFLVQGEERMILAFESFRPRIAVLQEILRTTRSIVFSDESERRMSLPAFASG